MAGKFGVHFEGFQFAGDPDGGGTVFEDAVGLDEGIVFAEGGGAGEDEAGEKGQLPGDGEGGFLAGEFVAGAAEFLDVGADGGVLIEARRGSMGGLALRGLIASQIVGFRGGMPLGDLFSEDFWAVLKGLGIHGYDASARFWDGRFKRPSIDVFRVSSRERGTGRYPARK